MDLKGVKVLRVVHFEIHADDPERAAKFYTDVFEWEIKKWEEGEEDYWLIMTGPEDAPGIDGGLMRRMEGEKKEGIGSYVCTIDVPDVDEYVEKIEKAGGEVAMPKMEVMKVGWLAYCKDTEGNLFGIITMPEM